MIPWDTSDTLDSMWMIARIHASLTNYHHLHYKLYLMDTDCMLSDQPMNRILWHIASIQLVQQMVDMYQLHIVYKQMHLLLRMIQLNNDCILWNHQPMKLYQLHIVNNSIVMEMIDNIQLNTVCSSQMPTMNNYQLHMDYMLSIHSCSNIDLHYTAHMMSGLMCSVLCLLNTVDKWMHLVGMRNYQLHTMCMLCYCLWMNIDQLHMVDMIVDVLLD
jgi:hypothetical protein